MYSQTYSDGKSTWDVRDLWEAASRLPSSLVPILELPGFEDLLGSYIWSKHEEWTKALTIAEILEHSDRVANADLTYPIILTPDGHIADGYHRVVKAIRKGHSSILAIRLGKMPEAVTCMPEQD